MMRIGMYKSHVEYYVPPLGPHNTLYHRYYTGVIGNGLRVKSPPPDSAV